MPPETQNQDFLRLHRHTGSDLSRPIQMDWELVASFILQTAGASMIITGLPARRFFKLYIQHGAKSGASNNFLRFNNSSSGYTFIEEINNTARISQTEFDLIDGANSATGYFYIIDIINVGNLEKIIDSVAIRRITAAGTAQTRHRLSGTWINVNSYISRIDFLSSNSETYPSGSTMTLFASKE